MLPVKRSFASIVAVPDFWDVTAIVQTPSLKSGIDAISIFGSALPLNMIFKFFPSTGSRRVLPKESFAIIFTSNLSPACALRGPLMENALNLLGTIEISFDRMGIVMPLSRIDKLTVSAILSVTLMVDVPFAKAEDLKTVGFTSAEPETDT